VKRLKGKNNGEKDIAKRRVRKWMREETSEATTRLFWTIEIQRSHGVSVHVNRATVVSIQQKQVTFAFVDLWLEYINYRSHKFKNMVGMLTKQHNFVI